MCKECQQHRAVYGEHCLYCYGDRPTRQTAQRLLMCLSSSLQNPLHLLLPIPNLVR